MRRPVATTIAVALLAATLLTGCGRMASSGDDTTPADSPGTVQEGADSGLESVDENLSAVDDALAQSGEDAGAGDSAAATDDEP